ncbi:hypothetical protein [Acinetobacter schindleri]|uniref:hypothetical protein n=1 Tax=Acinetobacter schindleri TaxID=108981 RepID=UPI003F558E48
MKIIAIFFSFLVMSACYANDLNKSISNADELNIKNFGFSYCMTMTQDQAFSSEAALAMGGYFQHGSYEEPAYKNLKKYINQYMKTKTKVYKSNAMPAILMHCLDLYNSTEYKEMIKQQHHYLIR